MSADAITRLFLTGHAQVVEIRAQVTALRELVAEHVAASRGQDMADVLAAIDERAKMIHGEYLLAAENICPEFGARIDNRRVE